MKHYFLGLLAIVLTLALTQSLPAKQLADNGGSPGLFDRLDANGDGQITAKEVPKDKKRLFERLVRGEDKNDDGSLNRAEFAQGIKSRRAPRSLDEKQSSEIPGAKALKKMLGELDANGDGKIVPDEVPDRLQGSFKKALQIADGNKDGRLAKREINRASPRLARVAMQRTRGQMLAVGDAKHHGPGDAKRHGPGDAKRRGHKDAKRHGQGNAKRRGHGNAKRRGHGGTGHRRPGGAGHRGPAGPGMRLMRVLDTDHDGALSKQEIAAASSALGKLDKNSDGKISRNELMPRGRQGRPGQRPSRQGGPKQGQFGRGQPGRGQPGRGQPGRGGPRQFDPEKFVQRIMSLDKDGDGKISKQEAPDRLKKRFDHFDTDSDGLLTRQELREGAAKRGRRGGGRKQGDRR